MTKTTPQFADGYQPTLPLGMEIPWEYSESKEKDSKWRRDPKAKVEKVDGNRVAAISYLNSFTGKRQEIEVNSMRAMEDILFSAVEMGNEKTVARIVELGIAPLCQRFKTKTPLERAVAMGNAEMVGVMFRAVRQAAHASRKPDDGPEEFRMPLGPKQSRPSAQASLGFPTWPASRTICCLTCGAKPHCQIRKGIASSSSAITSEKSPRFWRCC
jgi:hypothetical protein